MTGAIESVWSRWLAVSPTGADDPPRALDEGPGDDDEALAASCGRGAGPDPFAALVGRHQDRVFRIVLSVLGPSAEADAQDVTQDVFIRVHRQLPGFRGDSRFRTWLYRVAFNLAVDRRRRARWRKPHVDDSVLQQRPTGDPAHDPHLSAIAAERARLVRRCLDDLPDLLRTVLHLHYWLDCPVGEIADMLGIPPGTVKSHLHRGRHRLHGAFQSRGFSRE